MKIIKEIQLEENKYLCFEFEDGRYYEIDIFTDQLIRHLKSKNWFNTADESEVEYFIELALQNKKFMGKEMELDAKTKTLYDHIHYELQLIFCRWKIYQQIYGKNTYRIELLNKTASHFFAWYEIMQINYTILSLDRLNEPFRKLIENLKNSKNSNFPNPNNEIDSSYSKFLVGSQFLYRQIKSLSHPAELVSRKDIQEVLEHGADIMNKINSRLNGSYMDYEGVVMPYDNDGKTLLICLQKALEYDELEVKNKLGDWEIIIKGIGPE